MDGSVDTAATCSEGFSQVADVTALSIRTYGGFSILLHGLCRLLSSFYKTMISTTHDTLGGCTNQVSIY